MYFQFLCCFEACLVSHNDYEKKNCLADIETRDYCFYLVFIFSDMVRLYNIPVDPLYKLSHHSSMKMIFVTLIVLSASVLSPIGKLSHQLSLSDSIGNLLISKTRL